ncbi:MAG: 1,4-alpha-glucan branching protein GlgB, partial [Gemmatimonadota bacterium]
MSRARPHLSPAHPDVDRLLTGDHHEPHQLLGAHPVSHDGQHGTVVRAFHPDAVAVECLLPGRGAVSLSRLAPGFFAGLLAGAKVPLSYRLRFHFANGDSWERDDPYRFLPTLGEVDLHLFNEGSHRRLWQCLGAHVRQYNGVNGVAFAVWAPNARRVSVVGDFCHWNGRVFPMRSLGSSGIFELFVPNLGPGAVYKFEIKAKDGSIAQKADPFARAAEAPPSTASIVEASEYQWADAEWMRQRPQRDHLREPMSIYEVHLGSWARVPEESNRPLSYREIAPRLVDHARQLGFTHLELLPVAEHPFTGSWGYQVSGYYAPTSRHGTPDDFRYFVDYCHQHGLGVIIDWVPAHFPKDDFALRRFDGTALYEHEDWRRGEHPDWGTLIFNYGRNEVRNFLMANALYWLQELHVDGLRVDAVASMLYLDYSRDDGQWIPNEYGGRDNVEAVAFLRNLNDIVAIECPGCFTVAEESTAWPGVTTSTRYGGLGFTFKWNMGWMHDTLVFFSKDPVHRRHHYDQLTFAMLYEYSERFIMPLSHDEVVHGKGSLLSKMPGDEWQKFANLRTLLTYQYTRPGKQLLFMGSEFAQDGEWNHAASLDWHRAADPLRVALQRFLADLGQLYIDSSSLWRRDPDPDGFAWIDCSDRDNTVISYLRSDGVSHMLVVLNLTPVPREPYRIGAPVEGEYSLAFNSNDARYGGSQFEMPARLATDPTPFHGYPQSLVLRLPPLAGLI